VQDVASGELPVLVTLSCRIDEFIRPGVFDVALVNDETDVLAVEVTPTSKKAPKLSWPVTFTGPPLKLDVSSVVSPKA